MKITTNIEKLVVFSILFFMGTRLGYAQSDPLTTQFMFSKYAINTAFAGGSADLNIVSNNRFQWTGLDGAPKTYQLNAETRLDAFNSTWGVGLKVISDEIGFFNNITYGLGISKPIKTGFGNLRLGLGINFVNSKLSGEWEVPDGDSYTGSTSDPLIPQGEHSQITPDFDMGIYLENPRYYVGLSVNHLLAPEVKYEGYESSYFLARHIYLMGGMNFETGNPLILIKPAIFVKSDMADVQLDLNAIIEYDQQFWGGITFRTGSAVSLLLGMELFSGLKVGYSYDLDLGKFVSFGGSHEVYLSYAMRLIKRGKKNYKSIRHL
ncbi:MAG: PorP/SprF family type IX secretion system membrane protein [Bacteroidales bacterium]